MSQVTRPKVIIYSTPTCHFCHKAKDFFEENNVDYDDYDVSVDAEKRMEMIQKTGQLGVPVIVIGENIIIGFNQAKVEELLEVESVPPVEADF